MITIDSCSKQVVDRLLGLGEDAVQGGKPDEDYEQRSTEWKVIRPLLVSAPAMFKGLKEIVRICQGSSDPLTICCAALARTALDGFLIAEGT
jgi:hypothetical protein